MSQKTPNTPEKKKDGVKEKTIAELLATGKYEYLGGGLIKKKEKEDEK